jgi:hypothetical protein
VGRVLVGGAALLLLFFIVFGIVKWNLGGNSTLTVINRGTLEVSGLSLNSEGGDKRDLKPVMPGDSVRFVFRHLREQIYVARLRRSDKSTAEVNLGMPSDGEGIDDILFVTDTTVFRRRLRP